MCPIVDSYDRHCFWFKLVYEVGEKGVNMILEGVVWEMCKGLDVKVGCVDWVELLFPIGVWDK